MEKRKHKKVTKRYKQQKDKSVYSFIDELLSSIKKETSLMHSKDEWIEKTAGSYATGKKDALTELFK
jgi:hypothetical protein